MTDLHHFGWNRTDVHEAIARIVAIAAGHGGGSREVAAGALAAIQDELDAVGLTAGLVEHGKRLLAEGAPDPAPTVARTLIG